MQTENIKKIIVIGAVCATVGLIAYDMQYSDQEQRVRSRIGPNIESIKKMNIQKDMQKMPALKTPNIGKPNMGKPNMGKPNMGKPNMGKPNMGKPNMGKPNMGKPNMGKPNMGKLKRSKQFQAQIVKNNVSGIGAMIIQLGDFIYIQESLPKGPADNAGLKSGDRILSINGINSDELSFKEIIDLIRGEAGTAVTLEIERQNGDAIALDIERTKLNHQMKIFG